MSTISFTPGLLVALFAAIAIDLVLRGFALWRAAQRKDKVWFIILLILNTIGILPLIYLLFFSKSNQKKSNKK